jgi:acyl-CoA reductase-like NAD-dependent aldehyde dehydrogenase
MTRFLNYIGGERRPAAKGWLDSVDPATGEVWAQVPAGGAADIDDAVRAARRAFPQWRDTPPLQRAMKLRAWADAIMANAQELAEIESRDNGRVLKETRQGDLPGSSLQVHYHAGLADKIVGDTIRINPSAFTYTQYEPYGVVGVIIPWNAPLAMFFAKVSGALAAGNAVVVKPAEQAACSILAACRLFDEVGFPPGLVNVVVGEGADAGDALVGHDGVAMVHFTGSTATGKKIKQRSAGNLKNVSLELGGKSPNIVFPDADLDKATVGVATGIYTGGAGQSCIAGSRILIHAEIFDDVVARLESYASKINVGDPMDPATDMGPVAFRGQYEKVRSYLDPATVIFGGRSGAELTTTGGFFVEPTLLDATAERACREEIFGPVAVAIPFTDEAEAIAIANDTSFGLAAGVWTESLGTAHRMVDALEAGTVWVNTYRRLHWALPFGGHKESGNTPANGVEALREWMNLKSVWMEI